VLAAGEGRGGGLGLLGARFGVLDRAEVAPASGAPAASECGRCGCRSRRGQARCSGGRGPSRPGGSGGP
jgi:hypothetical protein